MGPPADSCRRAARVPQRSVLGRLRRGGVGGDGAVVGHHQADDRHELGVSNHPPGPDGPSSCGPAWSGEPTLIGVPFDTGKPLPIGLDSVIKRAMKVGKNALYLIVKNGASFA